MKLVDLPEHHAILLVANDRTQIAESLFNELLKQSPVHRFFNQTVLDIEVARSIITWAQTSYNEKKVAVISFHTAGHEAQNALLKIFEEPRFGVKFILVTSNEEQIIPTVLSRLHHTRVLHGDLNTDDAILFLKTKPRERMKLESIVSILSKVDEEDRKDREGVRAFILSLAYALSMNKGYSVYVESTLETASFASLPSTSGKSLLEYLSLLLPQISV